MSDQIKRINLSEVQYSLMTRSWVIANRLNRILESIRGVHPEGEGKASDPRSFLEITEHMSQGQDAALLHLDELEALLLHNEEAQGFEDRLPEKKPKKKK